jgi:glycosyltransferase involved in cell wall biosynthesis
MERRADRFSPDVAFLHGARLAPLAARARVPTVLAPHAASVGGPSRSSVARLGAWLGVHTAEGWQRRWFPAATACVVGSGDERAALARWLPAARVDVVPAGVDLKRYEFRRMAPGGRRIVFAGDLASRAHVAAARRFVRAVLPRIRRVHPDAELLLVGTAPSAAGRAMARVPGIRVMAPVADVRPSVWGAAVCASPLDDAARSLVLPAMALGTPVVASSTSLGGVPDVVDGRHLLLADNDADAATALITVLAEPGLATSIARNARDLVERRYSWPAIAARHEAVLRRVAGHTEAPALRRAA